MIVLEKSGRIFLRQPGWYRRSFAALVPIYRGQGLFCIQKNQKKEGCFL
jgi:hypothetical protein